jgi:L-lactate dehydrogenase complex protein LldG
LTKKFVEELEALGGTFHKCTLENVLQTILEILRGHGIDEILTWDAAYLPDKLLDGLDGAGIQIIFPTGENIQTSSQIRAGLTGASAGIAETGSILVLGGPGQPLTASLLPEIHIALIMEKDIFNQLSQVLKLDGIEQASAGVLVSGPSRTADIEMTLTIGVHGPGELHVICIKSN